MSGSVAALSRPHTHLFTHFSPHWGQRSESTVSKAPALVVKVPGIPSLCPSVCSGHRRAALPHRTRAHACTHTHTHTHTCATETHRAGTHVHTGTRVHTHRAHLHTPTHRREDTRTQRGTHKHRRVRTHTHLQGTLAHTYPQA